MEDTETRRHRVQRAEAEAEAEAEHMVEALELAAIGRFGKWGGVGYTRGREQLERGLGRERRGDRVAACSVYTSHAHL